MLTITAAGRVGKDAETRNTQGGEKVTSFSLAVDVRKGREKETAWVSCTIWGDRGEKVAPYLTRGTSVAVSGDLHVRQYESQGKAGVSTECRVVNLTLLGGRQDGDEGGRQPQQRGGGSYGGRNSAPDLDDEIPF